MVKKLIKKATDKSEEALNAINKQKGAKKYLYFGVAGIGLLAAIACIPGVIPATLSVGREMFKRKKGTLKEGVRN